MADSQVLISKQLPEKHDYLAPDGSKIHELVVAERGSLARCILPLNKATRPVIHRTVEEIWYCLSGEGVVWRSLGDCQVVIPIRVGTSLTIPTGVRFQFRNTGSTPLCLLLTTMPPWPGSDEAMPAEGYWPADVKE